MENIFVFVYIVYVHSHTNKYFHDLDWWVQTPIPIVNGDNFFTIITEMNTWNVDSYKYGYTICVEEEEEESSSTLSTMFTMFSHL